MLIVSNDDHKHHISFDMVSKKNVKHRYNKIDLVENFINEYLLQNIEQGNDAKKWKFVEKYMNHLSIDDINAINKQYGTKQIENDLINYYIEIYKNMEFVFEHHINMIENETDEKIKKNMTSLILFNAITYSSFLF